MTRHKEPLLKDKLSKQIKSNRRVPVWAILRTRDRSLASTRKRNWRSSKLKLHTKHQKHEYRRLKTLAKRKFKGKNTKKVKKNGRRH